MGSKILQKVAIALIIIMNRIKLTSARKAILDHLEHIQGHVTPKQIHAALIDRLPSLNLTTVYRSLEYLVEHGLISVTDIGIGSPVYEKIHEVPHHHLVCLNCHEIIQIEHGPIDAFFNSLKEKHKFLIQTNHLVLYGTCLDCQQD